jgi:hypothetical protein
MQEMECWNGGVLYAVTAKPEVTWKRKPTDGVETQHQRTMLDEACLDRASEQAFQVGEGLRHRDIRLTAEVALRRSWREVSSPANRVMAGSRLASKNAALEQCLLSHKPGGLFSVSRGKSTWQRLDSRLGSSRLSDSLPCRHLLWLLAFQFH